MPSERRTLAIASAGTLLVLAAFTIPIASLAGISADLGSGPSAQTWILSSMSLGLALALLSVGALGDALGRRRVLVAGAVVLALGSVLCAAAPGSLVLILGRVVQGIGGAAVLACSLAVLGHAFPAGPARIRATGLWGASVGAGIAAGPLVAAGLQNALNWRAPQVLVAVAAVGLAGAAARGIAESRAEDVRAVDVIGVVLLAGGLACALAGLTEGRQGWTRPPVLVLLVVGVALLVGFAGYEHVRRHRAMLDLDLFGQPAFAAATLAALINGLGVIALMSFLPSLVQGALGHGVLTAALMLLGWSLTSVATALAARRLPPRIGPQLQLVVSLFVVALGLLLLAGLGGDVSLGRLLPGIVVAGAGSGVLNAALGRQAVASVPPARAGMGSGANNTARYLGSAIGVTIVSVLATHAASDPLAGWNHAALVTAAISAVGALLIVPLGRRTAQP